MEKEKTQDEFYKEFEQNASSEDVAKIDEKLEGMNKGKIAEIWEKVMLLYALIKDPNAALVSKAAAIGALVYRNFSVKYTCRIINYQSATYGFR